MSNIEKIDGVVSHLLTNVRGQLEGELRAFVDQLERAESEARAQAVADAVRSTTEELRREAEVQLQQSREVAAREADDLRRAADDQAEALRRQVQEVRQAVSAEAEERLNAQLSLVSEEHSRRMAAASGMIEDLRREVEEVRRTVAADVEARFANRLTAAAAEHERELGVAGAKMDALRVEIEEAKEAAEETERRLTAQLSAAIDDRERERSEAAATIEELTREIEEARRSSSAAAEERHRAQVAELNAQHERARQEAAATAREEGRREQATRVGRLQDAMKALDAAGSLSAGLEELGARAAREIDRVGVLILKGGRLQPWRLHGFDQATASSAEIDLDAAGVAGDTVRSGTATLGGHVPSFAQGGGERFALAFPVTVGWAVVAVLYADAPQADAEAVRGGGSTALDVLARHASKVLEATTLQQAIGLFTPAGSVTPDQSISSHTPPQ